ncbi:MAG: hypothetical protein ACOC56_00485 [Atribacterota bacterium]
MKNKKGITLLVGLMLATILFLLGLAIAPALSDTLSETSDKLNCDSDSISQPRQALCTSIDMHHLFIPIIFGFAGLTIWRLV